MWRYFFNASHFVKVGIFLDIYQEYTNETERQNITEIFKDDNELDALHISGSYLDDSNPDFIRKNEDGSETINPSFDCLTVNLSYEGENELIHDVIKRYNDFLKSLNNNKTGALAYRAPLTLKT